ncbi:hypothetical protein [Kitasatospora phosalacinea]|nr:hypothetical protein [Kitasatospora phosalacinea]
MYRSICAKHPAAGTAMSKVAVRPSATVAVAKSVICCRPEVANVAPCAR